MGRAVFMACNRQAHDEFVLGVDFMISLSRSENNATCFSLATRAFYQYRNPFFERQASSGVFCR